jgi:ribonucleoside-triphosphate reductase
MGKMIGDEIMFIVKRNGNKVPFEKEKIEKAIIKSMKYGSGIIKKDIAKKISEDVYEIFKDDEEPPTVYQVENMVYHSLVSYNEVLTAKSYEGYRAVQAYKRESNTTDDSVMGLLNRINDEVMNENSNKNAVIVSTQRDLVAGEISKDLARRKLIPANIVQAHGDGMLHFHDMDCAKRFLETL